MALFDAADVAAEQSPMRAVRTRLDSFASTFDQRDSASKRQQVVKVVRTALRKAGNLARYIVESQTRALCNGMQMRLFHSYLHLGLSMPVFLQNIPVRTAYVFARSHYRPKISFDGELALFAATSGVGFDEPFRSRYSDPLMGWGRRAIRGVRAFDVPGGHSSMLQEPNVRVVGEYLQAYIDKVVKQSNGALSRDAKSAVGPASPGARLQSPGESLVAATMASSACDGKLTANAIIKGRRP